MFRSVQDRVHYGTVHSVYMGPARNWNDTVKYEITIISGPIWNQIADPISTGLTRSRLNTRLILTSVVPVRNGSRCRVNAALDS